MEPIIITVSPPVPCNGCNRPATVGPVWHAKGGTIYQFDAICKECSKAMYQSYHEGGLPGQVAPLPRWEYPREVRTSMALPCVQCGVETNKSRVGRTGEKHPRHVLLYPYCCEEHK